MKHECKQKKKLTDAIKSIYLGNIFRKFLWKKKKKAIEFQMVFYISYAHVKECS